MRKLVFFITILITFSLISQEIMKLSDVKVGMKGIGRTIFKGTKIETFDFKVLGVLKNFAPNKNLIIVELNSQYLKDMGILQGMSGSPVYIDNKIVGSVSYGFSFSKKPIAGVTPIEDIIEVKNYDNRYDIRIDVSDIRVKTDKKNLDFIKNVLKSELNKRVNFSPLEKLKPIRPFINKNGYLKNSTSFMDQIFQPLSINGVKKIKKKDILKIFDLKPADAVSIPLVSGDFEYSASGTVTYVKGKDVYVFGHPFFNLGSVNFPMHRAEVITVVPSYNSPFKLVATLNRVGIITQDRFSAVKGELGKKPYMIPVNVYNSKRDRRYKFEMVNHPLLSPSLTYISLVNIFMSDFQQYGFQTIYIKGKIFIKGYKNIILDDIYTGYTSGDDFSNLMMAINFFLLNNKEKPIKIQRIDLEFTTYEDIRRTVIENVIVNKTEVEPDEDIDLKLILRDERGNYRYEPIRIPAPRLKPGAEFYLLFGGARELSRFESKNIKSKYFPNKLNNLIRAINNLRKNSRLYIKMFTNKSGLFINGYEYTNLPKSLSNMFLFRKNSPSIGSVKYSTLREYQLPLDSAVEGEKTLKFKIKERKNEDY